MSNIYFFQAIQTFVVALIGIFIPLYLYSKGIGLFYIVLFACGIAFFKLILLPLSTIILNKVGFKWSIFLSLPIYVMYLYSLSFVELSLYHLFFSSFLGGLYVTVFWPAMHAEVAHRSLGHSNEIGNLQIIITLMSALAPLIGGLFLQFTSYELVLLFSLGLLAGGSIPLLMSKDLTLKKLHYSYSDMWKQFCKTKLKNSLPYIGEGIETFLVLFIAPVLFFIWLKGNFATVGAILSVFSYISIVFVVFFKSFIKNKSKQSSVVVVARVSGLQWLIRTIAYIIGGVVVLLIEGAYKMINQAFYITYFSLFYNKKDPKVMFNKIMQRELFISSSRLVVGLIALALVYLLGESVNLLIALLVIGLFSSTLKGFIALID